MRATNRARLGLVLVLATGAMLPACSNVPSAMSSAPKIIEADGNYYTACSGTIFIYQPSRDVGDSSQKTYEVTFTDDYGKAQDLKPVKSYTILKPDQSESGSPPNAKQALTYAMPAAANPENMTTVYSNGQPMTEGSIVWFGNNGDSGRARWEGPGKWEAVPCN